MDAAVGNVAVKDSDIADNIGNNNHVSVLPRDLVTVGALIEALANALAEVRTIHSFDFIPTKGLY